MTLTWKWFNQIARALCYVSGNGEEAVRALSWPEREAQPLQCLDEKPYLFVLGAGAVLLRDGLIGASLIGTESPAALQEKSYVLERWALFPAVRSLNGGPRGWHNKSAWSRIRREVLADLGET